MGRRLGVGGLRAHTVRSPRLVVERNSGPQVRRRPTADVGSFFALKL